MHSLQLFDQLMSRPTPTMFNPVALLSRSLLVLALCAATHAASFAASFTITFGENGQLMYLPPMISIAPGDTLTWQGNFSMHPMRFTEVPAGATKPSDITSGTEFRYVAQIEGTYNYICITHEGQGMTGSFRVVKATPPTVPVHRILFGMNGQLRYLPPMVNAQIGDTILWSGDFSVHPLRFTEVPAGTTKPADVTSGEEFKYVVRANGQYRFVCITHQADGMQGTVQVGEFTPPVPVHTITFGQNGELKYTPSLLNAALNDTILFKGDFSMHPLRFTDVPMGAVKPADITSGTEFKYVPVFNGEYKYVCISHQGSGMKGSFKVGLPVAQVNTIQFGLGGQLTYVPPMLEVQTGDTILWIGDFSMHPLRFTEVPSGVTKPADVTTGTEFRYVIPVDGTYKYICIAHEGAGMKGEITSSTASVNSPQPAVDANALIAMPNPVASKARLMVVLGFIPSSIEEIKVCNTEGKCISIDPSVYTLEGDRMTIYLERVQLTPGAHILSFVSQGSTRTAKFVVN
jgi:plastocyanin